MINDKYAKGTALIADLLRRCRDETASPHLLTEEVNRAEVLYQFDAADERPLAAYTARNLLLSQRFKSLPLRIGLTLK